MTDLILLITEILGTIAFALSGAVTAIDRKLDVFGVVFIGCITACGGGAIRDICIGRFPPTVFTKPYVLGIAAASALAVFVIVYFMRDKYDRIHHLIDTGNNVFDAIGLASFSVVGTDIAIQAGYASNPVLCIFLGMTTGVGGGILRDMMTNETPYVFVKHIYAIASIAGSAVYFVAAPYTERTVAVLISMTVVVTIRLLAAHYRWSLPKIMK